MLQHPTAASYKNHSQKISISFPEGQFSSYNTFCLIIIEDCKFKTKIFFKKAVSQKNQKNFYFAKVLKLHSPAMFQLNLDKPYTMQLRTLFHHNVDSWLSVGVVLHVCTFDLHNVSAKCTLQVSQTLNNNRPSLCAFLSECNCFRYLHVLSNSFSSCRLKEAEQAKSCIVGRPLAYTGANGETNTCTPCRCWLCLSAQSAKKRISSSHLSRHEVQPVALTCN